MTLTAFSEMFGHLKLNYSTLNFFQLYSYTRLIASVINYEDPKVTNNRCRRSNPNLILLRFRSDIEILEEILENLPKVFRQKSALKYSYFFPIKREVSAKIAGTVMNSVRQKKGKTNVVQVNPGLGFIAEELIKNDLEKLIVFDSLICPYFTKWASDYKERIQIRVLKYNFKGWNVLEFLKIVDSGEQYTIIVSLPKINLFRVILKQIIFFDWSSFKNVEFYLIVTPVFYKCFYDGIGRNCKPYDYGLINILFDTEILDEFHCSDFFPLIKTEDGKVYLVRLMRKAKCSLRKREAQFYYLFLSNVMTYKNRFIIKSVENWFPGIGPGLIANGVKVTSCVNDYTPEELIKLFRLIKELGWNYRSLKL